MLLLNISASRIKDAVAVTALSIAFAGTVTCAAEATAQMPTSATATAQFDEYYPSHLGVPIKLGAPVKTLVTGNHRNINLRISVEDVVDRPGMNDVRNVSVVGDDDQFTT